MNNPWAKRLRALTPVLVVLALAFAPACSGTIQAAQKTSQKAKTVLPPEAAGLEPFFRALYALETGRTKKPVYILHLGDSHTAGGWFSGRLRSRFQKRFGSAGRGHMPPGVPFRWYYPTNVTARQSDGWTVAGSFRSTKGLFGVAGFRTVSDDPEAVMSLECHDPKGFERAEIEVVTGPDAGTMIVRVDDRLVREVSTRANRVRARRVEIKTRPGSRLLEVSPKGDGPVELLAWNLERQKPGIVYDSHGIVGATIDIIGRWTPEVVTWELAHRPPSLILLEYGGNEGFHDDLDPADYETIVRRRTAFFARAAPKSSLLLVGPADGMRLPRYCIELREKEQKRKAEEEKKKAAAMKNDTGGKAAIPKPKAPEENEFECRPLTSGETAQYELLFENEDPALCRWHRPPKLDVVREIQRAVAKEKGYPFWDWSSMMEGDCGIQEWVLADPPLAFGDRVHLKAKGYVTSADTLFDILMEYYEDYRRLVKRK